MGDKIKVDLDKNCNLKVFKGEIYLIDFAHCVGSEQKGKRPAVVLQNNQGNITSTTTIVAPLTKQDNNKHNIPTHILVSKNKFIEFDSIILMEQTRVIDKRRIIKYLGRLEDRYLDEIDRKIIKTFGIRGRKIDG